MVSTPYSQSVTALGGFAPYTYSIFSGALPTGFSLNPATGLISGATLQQGFFSFTIRATDSGGCIGARTYTLLILGPASAVIPTLDTLALTIFAVLLAAAGAFAANRFMA